MAGDVLWSLPSWCLVPVAELDPDAVRQPDVAQTPRCPWGRFPSYEEAGADYYQVADKDRVKDKLVRRLQKLGYAATVAVAASAA